LSVIDWYQPTWVRVLNDNDQDFGGSSPIVLPPIGGRQLVVTTAKDGNVYLLDGKLGGWGAELWSSVTNPGDPSNGAFFGRESKCCPAYFHDAVGNDDYVYVAGSNHPGLAAFKVDVSGSTPRLVPAWNAGMSFGDAPGSAFVIADPTTQKALVWVVDGVVEDGKPSVLRAFDAVSGALVFRSDALAGNDVGQCPHFAPVVGAGNSVFVGTNSGVVGYVHVGSGLPPTFSLLIAPGTVIADVQNATVTLTIPALAPPNGRSFILRSFNPALCAVPPVATIQGGSKTEKLTITTSPLTINIPREDVIISASEWSGITIGTDAYPATPHENIYVGRCAAYSNRAYQGKRPIRDLGS
jgi:hypothetical protein